MYTDNTDSLKQEGPSLRVSFLSVLVVKFVVKILFLPAEEEIEPRSMPKDAKGRLRILTKVTELGTGGSMDPLFRCMAVVSCKEIAE